jgi:hypothetical protein
MDVLFKYNPADPPALPGFCATAKISQYISEPSIGYIHCHETSKISLLEDP